MCFCYKSANFPFISLSLSLSLSLYIYIYIDEDDKILNIMVHGILFFLKEPNIMELIVYKIRQKSCNSIVYSPL